MSVFQDEEIEYLNSQLLGRLATVGPDSQPHAVAVSFRYNAQLDTIDIGGHDFARRKIGALADQSCESPSSRDVYMLRVTGGEARLHVDQNCFLRQN